MSDDPRKKPFKSFADLRRAKDPAPPTNAGEPTPPKQERGWTFDGDADTIESASDATLAPTVALRPRGFGPMEHGPACYADLDSEEMRLLASFRVRTVFPEDVLAEVRSLPRDPDAHDTQGRLDLRKRTIFTIDGDDAKDFDDAISIEPLEGGRFEIGVHIADVAHYVRPETVLDAEARTRGTSVYLADQVVPMLPEELSNHLCSLVEGRDRLTYSVLLVFDEAGRRLEARVAKSVIRSVKRCTYRGVQDLLDRLDTPKARELAFLEAPLRLFQKWTVRQQSLRDAKGSLRLPSREKKIVFDEAHEVRAVVDAQHTFSMALIEETALAANQAVGELFRERGLPTIYRVHPEKDSDEIAAVAKVLLEHGIRVPEKDRLTGRDIGRMIRAARRRPNAEALVSRILGLIERALYEVHDSEDEATHFGLARKSYLHFTSPIRRYPDLVVHRWLWAVESRGGEAAQELKADALLADLNQIAAHSSAQSEIAEMAEQAIFDLKVCQYLHPHVGEKLAARVVRVSPPGLEVVLTEFNVSGFLPTRAIGERGEVKGPTILIRRGREVRSFTEGHPIAVRLKDVDFLKLQILLELA